MGGRVAWQIVGIGDHVPGALTGFFEVVTFTGSFRVLFPLAAAATIALLSMRRRFEAVLIASSVISAAAVVYSSRLWLAELAQRRLASTLSVN